MLRKKNSGSHAHHEQIDEANIEQKKGKIQLKEYLQLDKKNLSKVIQNGLANVLCHIKFIHFKYMTNKCSSKT